MAISLGVYPIFRHTHIFFHKLQDSKLWHWLISPSESSDWAKALVLEWCEELSSSSKSGAFKLWTFWTSCRFAEIRCLCGAYRGAIYMGGCKSTSWAAQVSCMKSWKTGFPWAAQLSRPNKNHDAMQGPPESCPSSMKPWQSQANLAEACIWYDMIWYDMIWYDMIWYDM